MIRVENHLLLRAALHDSVMLFAGDDLVLAGRPVDARSPAEHAHSLDAAYLWSVRSEVNHSFSR